MSHTTRRYLTARDLCERWGIGRATLHRQRAAGYVPKPVHFGPRSVKWPIEEVEAFERRLAEDRGSREP